ncbi:FAD-dependent oxidoreductase [Streptomyces sp. NPDC017993]|uniref:FAD-dependent oxidoreductase n=1 Tax=Streptomyces sp. NPDC017993 TaxID=3365027 RepID=UPI0037ACB2EB
MTAQVIVLGGGIAGLAAAAALAAPGAQVTVLDRARPHAGPAPRAGVPQGRHVHGLLSTGAEAMDVLLPGTLDDLYSRGAHRIGLPHQTQIYGPTAGWTPSPRGTTSWEPPGPWSNTPCAPASLHGSASCRPPKPSVCSAPPDGSPECAPAAAPTERRAQ